MSYRQFRASLQKPALIAVAEHWNSARRGRLMPSWRDIDPQAIKKYLSIVWAWRWDAGLATFIGRLAGEDNIAIIGTNTHGKKVEECFPPGAYELVKARLMRVIEGPELMRSGGRIRLISGREGHGDRIILPLAEDGAHADGIIGVTVYKLGVRPRMGDASIDPFHEAVDFFPLGDAAA